MFARKLLVAGAAVLALTGPAVAQIVYTGTVARVDAPASVVILSDGRMVRVPGGAVLVSGQPVVLSAVQPGSVVTIQDGQYVVYRNGAYVAAKPTRAPYEVSGRAMRIQTPDNVLVLDGGRAIPLTPDMQVFQDGRQVALESIRPGGYVTIWSVSPIPFRDRAAFRERGKKKAVMAAPAPATAAAVSTESPATTVVTPATAPLVYTGTIAEIHPIWVMFTDGRLIAVNDQTVYLVHEHPVAVSTLTPGTEVMIYPHGQHAMLTTDDGNAPSASVVTEAATVPDEPIKLEGGLREFEATRQAP